MMTKFKSWLTSNLFSIITFIWPTISVLFTAFWANIKNTFTVLDMILILALVLQEVILISYFIWRSNSYKSYHYPASLIRPDYEVLKRDIYYKMNKINDSEYTLDFSHTRNIKCCTHRLERISCKFLWTGNGTPEIPSYGKGKEIRVESQKKGIWTFYDVILGKCLFKGETTTITGKYATIPNCKSSSPFVSTSTDEPTKQLIFHIDLGNEYAGKKITIETYRSNESSYPLHSEEKSLDSEGKIDYDVPEVKRFRYYTIRWDWN